MIDKIIAFESGELDEAGILDLFSELVGNGMAWSLQGSYGRFAASLIEQGLISPDGTVTDAGRELVSA